MARFFAANLLLSLSSCFVGLLDGGLSFHKFLPFSHPFGMISVFFIFLLDFIGYPHRSVLRITLTLLHYLHGS